MNRKPAIQSINHQDNYQWRSLEVGASGWLPQSQTLSVHLFYQHGYYTPLSPHSSLYPESQLLKPQFQVLSLCTRRPLWKGGLWATGGSSWWEKYFPGVPNSCCTFWLTGQDLSCGHTLAQEAGNVDIRRSRNTTTGLSQLCFFFLSWFTTTEIKKSLPTSWTKVKKAGWGEGTCPWVGNKVHLPRQQRYGCQGSWPWSRTSRFLDLGSLHGFLHSRW